jgi:hypothetical protein
LGFWGSDSLLLFRGELYDVRRLRVFLVDACYLFNRLSQQLPLTLR